MIEHIYCISLENITRRTFMKKQLKKFFNNKYTIVNAETIENNQMIVPTFNNLICKKNNIDALSQIAICFSHLKCLKKIVKKKLHFGAIIEDDIRIKDNFNEHLHNYFMNTPNVYQDMMNKPCIIHICGPYNYIFGDNKFYKKKDDEIIVNICFYIINHMLAKILIDNFYPIKWQFDTYVSKLLHEKNIMEYTANPILAWDLSSTIYSKFWSIEDRKIRKNMTTTSRLNKTKELIMKCNIFNDSCSNIQYYLFQKITGNKVNIISNQNTLHYLTPMANLAYANNNTIIAGQGIYDLDDQINIPYLTLFVRGPLTRKMFLKHKIKCPKLYIEPFIIYNKLNNTNKKNIILRKYIILLDNDYKYKINNENIKIFNINKIDIKTLINHIVYSEIIISNIYEILVIASSFNKIVYPLKTDVIDVRYIDYILGYENIINKYKISDLNYLKLDDVINKIRYNKPISYPQINYNELIDKQNILIDMLPYLDYK